MSKHLHFRLIFSLRKVFMCTFYFEGRRERQGGKESGGRERDWERFFPYRKKAKQDISQYPVFTEGQ